MDHTQFEQRLVPTIGLRVTRNVIRKPAGKRTHSHGFGFTLMSPGYHPRVRNIPFLIVRARYPATNLVDKMVRSRCVVVYKAPPEGTPWIRFSSDGELPSLRCGPLPFRSLPLLLSFTFFFALLRRPISRDTPLDLFFSHPPKQPTKCPRQDPVAQAIRMSPRACPRSSGRGVRLLVDNAGPRFALSSL